ncbi:MAG: hemolysin III family protein, partial [Pseudomonadota bacterium]
MTFSRRAGYSRAEYLSDLAVHVLGLLIVIGSVPALITAAALSSDTAAPVAGTVLYGVSFAAMIGASAAYNIFPHPNWEWLLKRLDHSAIYV